MTKREILQLDGRVALVTGAGQGVGRQVAIDLASHGAAAVVVNDFYEDRARSVAEEIEAEGGRAMAVAGDVGDFEAVGAMFARVADEVGAVDVLINNAGNAGPSGSATFPPPFWEQSPPEWAGYLNTNLFGVFNCTRHALDGMIAKRSGGRIVTVISDAGRVGEGGLEIYSAAKAGAAGFTRAVARLGGRFAITANSVSLAATRTPFVADALSDAEAAKQQLKRYVIRRFGEPEDAAGMIVFLASEASGWITGQTIPVNGGYSMSL